MASTILITIDVEDWFQVENFKQYIPFSTWSSYEFRVEKNVHRLLDLFDSCNLQPATRNMEPGYELSAISYEESSKKNIKATFFILGWLAKRLPHLVREIQVRGHEVASHGFDHNLCNEEPKDRLKQDLLDSKKLLEDITGVSVFGYRAPSFSISDDTLKVIEECGYLYDSSFNSFAMHGRYGKILLNSYIKKGISHQVSNDFFELPISNLEFNYPISYQLPAMSLGQNDKKRFVLPWGGGAYFRIIPFSIFKRGVESILKKENAYLFYMHPWEIDPDQPRVGKASSSCKFRHYINLNRTFLKLTRFIEYFGQCRFVTCRQYLDIIADSS
jgi:polysaccharide deacetylase family protein (PEP-CTERM system associated)